jgi:purine nucleosidase
MESAQKILDLTGRSDVQVYRGADSPLQLGQPTDASRFIIETVMAHPGQVEIIATAPLTNIATAMMLEPRLAENWKTLHMVTGEFWGKLGEWSDGTRLSKITGYEDLNTNVDVKAVEYVLKNGGPNVRVYVNEIMDDAFITRADLGEIKRADTPLARWVVSETSLWTVLMTLTGMPGAPLHGVISVALAVEPELAETPQEIRIGMGHLKRGGYYFTIEDDPSVPAYPVFIKLRDSQTIERRLVERCR